jgi:hypothetical protein
MAGQGDGIPGAAAVSGHPMLIEIALLTCSRPRLRKAG